MKKILSVCLLIGAILCFSSTLHAVNYVSTQFPPTLLMIQTVANTFGVPFDAVTYSGKVKNASPANSYTAYAIINSIDVAIITLQRTDTNYWYYRIVMNGEAVMGFL